MFQLQKISDYGTATPAVARTVPQGIEILNFFEADSTKKEACKEVLFELSRQLVRCVGVSNGIRSELETVREQMKGRGLQLQAQGGAVNLPGISDIQSKAESFLQSAKLAIREAAQLVAPFYDVEHDHRFQKFSLWAEKSFGSDDQLTQVIKNWEPFVKHVVSFRNAVDHPSKGPKGRLVVKNFHLNQTVFGANLVEPVWGLTGDVLTPMQEDMEGIIESIIELSEDILSSLFYKFKPNFPLMIFEIPIEKRDPNFPKRLHVSLASEFKDI